MGEQVSEAGRKLLAVLVLAGAAYVLLKVVIGFVTGLVWAAIAVIAVIGIVWAIRVL